ncbi:MAG: hypothetical protein ACXVXU_03960 [Blastococcus sp.]
MSADPHAVDVGTPLPSGVPEPPPGTGERQRPNVSGDLPSVLQAAPMFRRVVAGYDRFQVDTYVRWAEDELATADREREHLVARLFETRADLEEARALLSHSSGGGEFLQLSRRIGTMLAAAADEAERIRAEATSARAHAAGQATRTVARAEKALADAEAEAGRLVAEAATQVEDMTAQARCIVDREQQAAREIRAEADARLEEARVVEQRAVEHADRLHRQAMEAASAARLHARDEIVRMLDIAREQRRRADDEATGIRERLDRDAATRAAAFLAEAERMAARCAARSQVSAVVPPCRQSGRQERSPG